MMLATERRRWRALAAGIAVLAVVMACSAPAASPVAGTAKLPDEFDPAVIDAYLASYMASSNRVGLSVAIVREGQVVLQKGYGRRSLADDRPVDPDTVFAIGSVTKQFTCASVLLLAEDGKLSVKDPVAKYFPDLTRAKDITLLDLMNHVAGYPDYYPLDFADDRMAKPIAEDELLRQYAGGKLDFEPGSRFSYSNTGYILLGRVVEKVSGESFGAFLTRRILKPLGMGHTGYELNPADHRQAQGYTRFALGGPEPAVPEAKGWIAGAGGMFSTAGDLAKWNLALISGRVLKPESYALMTTTRTLSSGRVSDYGCGLTVKTQSGRQVLSHGGAVSGFFSWNATIPSTRSAVVMLCNLDDGLGPLPNRLVSLLLKEPSNVPVVAGSTVAETVNELFTQFQDGQVERNRLGKGFNHFLTEARLIGAARRLKPFGTPTQVDVLGVNERGGLEASSTRLTFGRDRLHVTMYRNPDGRIEQFLVSKE